MQINIKPDEGVVLPQYAHSGDAGMDLRAKIDEPIIIRPGHNALIPTGIHAQSGPGIYARIVPRSGLAANYRVIAVEGTIDTSEYLGEWKVDLINLGDEPFKVNSGDRIAQAIFMKYEKIEWNVVDSLEDTTRGTTGFGMSGIK